MSLPTIELIPNSDNSYSIYLGKLKYFPLNIHCLRDGRMVFEVFDVQDDYSPCIVGVCVVCRRAEYNCKGNNGLRIGRWLRLPIN